MTGLEGIRQLGAAASPRGFERVLEHFIAAATIDPERVVTEALRRGVPVTGDDVTARVTSLRRQPVHVLDPVASAFVRANCIVAGAQGFVTGLGGLGTLPIALSADTVGALYWVVRATSGVMNAYGFETASDEGVARLRVGLLLAMGIDTVDVAGRRVRLERVGRQVLSTPYSQQLLAAGGRRLARRMGTGALRGRAARAVPLVGGAVGGAINVGLVRGVGRRAQLHYRGLLVEWQEHARRRPALPAGEPGDSTTLPATHSTEQGASGTVPALPPPPRPWGSPAP